MYPYNKNTRTYQTDLEMKERMNGGPNGTINRFQNGTINDPVNGTPNGTINGVPNGTTNGVPNGTINGVPNGTINGVPNGTINGVPNGTTNGVPNGTTNGVPNGTINGIPNGTTNGVPNGTINGVPNSTINGNPNVTINGNPNVTINGIPNGSVSNTMNGVQNGTTTNGTMNGNLTEVQRTALAEDEKLIELLTLSQQESADMAERYASLMADPDMAPSATILRAMYLDELKHLNQLKEAYYLITGIRDEVEIVGNPPDASGQPLLEDTLLLEIDNGDFYRTLYLTMPTQDLRDIFFEMTSDKMRHGIALNYLFTKYFAA